MPKKRRGPVIVRRSTKGWIEYDILIVHADGTEFRERRMSPMKSEAATWKWAEAHAQKIIERGPDVVTESKTAPSFAAFAERTINEHDIGHGHKPSTIESKRIALRAHINPVFGERPIDSIGAGDIATFRASLAARMKPKTVNNVLTVLATVLKCAVEWDVIEKAPAVKLMKSAKRRMPFLTASHFDRLVAGAAKLRNPRALVIVLLGGDAGMRKGEILALEWSRVDLDRRLIAVEQSEVRGVVSAAKGNDWRVLPMTEMLHAALSALPHRKGRVLGGRTKTGGIERKTINGIVAEAEEAAELPITGKLHVLRHTFGSLSAQAGASIYKLKEMMGHSDIGTTEDYAKLNAEALRPLAAAIDTRRRVLLLPGRPPGEDQETNQQDEKHS